MIIKEPTFFGNIYNNNNQIEFDADNFSFLMTNVSREKIKLKSEDGFVYGNTSKGNAFALKSGNLSLLPSVKYNAHSYIISESKDIEKIKEFNSIEFRGGSLNLLLFNDAIRFNRSESIPLQRYVYDISRESIDFSFYYKDEKIDVCISKEFMINQTVRYTELNKKDIVVTLTFPNSHTLYDIYEYVHRMKELVAFMVYRRNIGFDEIIICNSDIKSNLNINEWFSYTEKKEEKCLQFTDFGEHLPKLFEFIFTYATPKATYNLGFIPTNDNEVAFVNYNTIKSTASSLELEFRKQEIKLNTDDDIKELSKQAIKLLKDYKEEHPEMEESVYNYIRGNINVWIAPFSKQIEALVKKFETPLKTITNNNIDFIYNNIPLFKKTRDHVTHGDIRILDTQINTITKTMIQLVYISILTRIGLSENELINIMKKHFLI